MTSAEILEPEIAATPATEIPGPNDARFYANLSPFKIGPSPDERASTESRAALEAAEQAAEEARCRVKSERNELIARQTRLGWAEVK